MGKMKTKSLGRQNQQNRPYKSYFHRVRGRGQNICRVAYVGYTLCVPLVYTYSGIECSSLTYIFDADLNINRQ